MEEIDKFRNMIFYIYIKVEYCIIVAFVY